jgi:hypothetical protein
MRLAGLVALMGERRVAYRALMGNPGRMRTHGRLRHRWESNIKVYLQEITFRVWTELPWLRAETSGGLLLTWSWKFGFHKMKDIA